MLGSITPLGERGRNRRWGVTVTAYVAGSTLVSAAIGSALGALGSLLPDHEPAARLWILALVTAAGLAFDAGIGGLRLPTVHRQVNQDWIGTYRGWVVGLGFGVQLGLGVATIVTTSTVYATMAAAFLSGNVRSGALIAGTFGLVRAAVVLAVAGVDRPEQLGRVDAWLRRWDGRARRATLAAGGALGVALAAGAMRWPS
jgi:cytochrome c biogenesis protein CcdA